jgi:hypothetical protein
MITAPLDDPSPSTQRPELVCNRAGQPAIATLAAAVTHSTRVHGDEPGAPATHPTIGLSSPTVSTGMSLTRTRVFEVMLVTLPPWGHIADAPK